MMMINIYICLQKLPKLILNTENSNIVLFLFGCVLIVSMATMCFNLQSVLLLSHNIQDVLFKNNDERYPYQSLKFAKN